MADCGEDEGKTTPLTHTIRRYTKSLSKRKTGGRREKGKISIYAVKK